ncbi:MAG: SH3 domain-containing protein [Candidatus Binatia bacterium]
MKEVPQFDVTLSYVALLLEQQRYDEALPILGSLMDMNPSDREARMYRVLVLRILVQRHYLSSNPTDRSARHPGSTANKVLAKLATVPGVLEMSNLIHALGRLCRATQPSFTKAAFNRLTVAAAACGILVTPLALYMGSSHVGFDERARPSSTGAWHPIVSAVDVKRYSPRNTTAADENDPERQLSSNADEWRVSRAMSDPTDLNLPLLFWTTPIPGKSDAGQTAKEQRGKFDGAKTTSQLEARRGVSKPKEFGSATTIQKTRRIAAKENLGKKTRKEILAQYESRRRVPVRESARFAADIVQEIARGTLVSVLEVRGSWAKVEIRDRGIIGFIRREFLIPVNLGLAVES